MAASNTRFTQSSLVNQKIPLTVITVSTATAAPQVHHAARRRGGGVAARGARAARREAREFITLLGGAAAAWPLAARAQQAERVRRIGVLMTAAADDPEAQARVGAFLQGLAATGLDRRPQRADRLPAGPQAMPPSIRRHAAELGRARAGRHPGRWRRGRGAVAAGDPQRADRVRDRPRSGRRRLRRQPGAAGRQRHRLHACSNTA